MNDQRTHPNFHGNQDDLRAFLNLANSPVRTQARSDALHEWEQYKLNRQYSAVPYGGKKGAHMRSLVAHVIDLRGANLDGITLGYVDLRGAMLDHCSLRGAWLKGANLENASLQHADLTVQPDSGRGAGRLLHADLRRADFTGADLTGVDLSGTRLEGAILSKANLTDADLEGASLIGTTLDGARLTRTRVYGISAWDLRGAAEVQHDLLITPQSEPPITVDNLKVAQFIYLLINNPEIRHVIDTITSKVVLILGRFTDDRKAVLYEIKSQLRSRDFLPIIFDFDAPTHRDVQETVATLAHMAHFIIADLTDPRSIPQELISIVPTLPSVPVKPLILKGQAPWAMFSNLMRYPWVLELFEYENSRQLADAIETEVVQPVRNYLAAVSTPQR